MKMGWSVGAVSRKVNTTDHRYRQAQHAVWFFTCRRSRCWGGGGGRQKTIPGCS